MGQKKTALIQVIKINFKINNMATNSQNAQSILQIYMDAQKYMQG
jgi:hypothetical protein